MKTCTIHQFREMADEMWKKVLSCQDQEKAQRIKKKEMKKLYQYKIIADFEPTGNPMVDEYCTTLRESTDEVNIYDGLCSSIDSFLRLSRTHDFEITEFGQSHCRAITVNNTERIILTFCEGSLSAVLAKSDEAFQRELSKARVFYEICK